MYVSEHFKFVWDITRLLDHSISEYEINEVYKSIGVDWKRNTGWYGLYNDFGLFNINNKYYKFLEGKSIYAYADRNQKPKCIARSTAYSGGKLEVPWYSEIIILPKSEIFTTLGEKWTISDKENREEFADKRLDDPESLFIIFNRLQIWERQQNAALLKQIRSSRRFGHYSRDL